MRRRKGPGGLGGMVVRVLQDTGTLKKSVGYDVHSDSVEIGSNTNYGKYHLLSHRKEDS